MKRIFLLLLAFATSWQGVNAEQATQTQASRNYVIQPSDVLRLHVFQEPDLTQDIRVPQNGRFHFPLIGPVQLTGKTVAEAEDLLRELYDRDYLVNPQVNLLILEFSQRRVNVYGAVNAPGPVVFPPEEEMTLLDAISRAGGFNRLANRRAVTLTRTGPDGQIIRFRINADELISGGADASVWKLEKDDVINVPERIL
jgi:polysaccharide biosynthesis/export protein